MRVAIRSERIFTLTINGNPSSGWKEISRWEGMVKLEREGQTVILDAPSGIENLFADVLGTDAEGAIVKASPSLIAEVGE